MKSIQEISQRLADSIESLCTYLFPAGKRAGQYFEVGSVNGEPGKTLKVNLAGDKRGRWIDWNGQDDKGDDLDLWAAARGVALPVALREAKDWLGIKDPIADQERTWNAPKDDKPEIQAAGRAMQWFTTERKIEPRIVNLFKVQADAEKRAVVFPSYSPDELLVNRSYRAITPGEDGKKKVWQDAGAAPSLFGWQSFSPEDYAKREVLICEGQIDAMTWRQWGFPALSLPNGSGKTWIPYEFNNLEAFKTIYLALDQDAAGKKNEAEIVSRLGKHRVRIVKYPHKDANEALKAGATQKDAEGWVEASEYQSVPHLVDASHFAEEVAEEFFPENGKEGHVLHYLTHRNDELSFRFRPAELTIWTGVSFHGKSTFLNASMLALAAKIKRPSLIISLEMAPKKILRRLILSTGVKISNRQEAKEATCYLKEWILFCDKIGNITKEELFEMLAYAHARYGIAHAAIDSLMRIRGLEENYPAQNEFVTDLVKFARESGVHIHLVAHPRKANNGDAPSSNDIKGSGHIRDNADNVMVVWRNIEKEKKQEAGEETEGMPDAKVFVEKDREDGNIREFPLNFVPHQYSYSRCEYVREGKKSYRK